MSIVKISDDDRTARLPLNPFTSHTCLHSLFSHWFQQTTMSPSTTHNRSPEKQKKKYRQQLYNFFFYTFCYLPVNGRQQLFLSKVNRNHWILQWIKEFLKKKKKYKLWTFPSVIRSRVAVMSVFNRSLRSNFLSIEIKQGQAKEQKQRNNKRKKTKESQ